MPESVGDPRGRRFDVGGPEWWQGGRGLIRARGADIRAGLRCLRKVWSSRGMSAYRVESAWRAGRACRAPSGFRVRRGLSRLRSCTARCRRTAHGSSAACWKGRPAASRTGRGPVVRNDGALPGCVSDVWGPAGWWSASGRRVVAGFAVAAGLLVGRQERGRVSGLERPCPVAVDARGAVALPAREARPHRGGSVAAGAVRVPLADDAGRESQRQQVEVGQLVVLQVGAEYESGRVAVEVPGNDQASGGLAGFPQEVVDVGRGGGDLERGAPAAVEGIRCVPASGRPAVLRRGCRRGGVLGKRGSPRSGGVYVQNGMISAVSRPSAVSRRRI